MSPIRYVIGNSSVPASKTRPSTSTIFTAMMFDSTSAIT